MFERRDVLKIAAAGLASQIAGAASPAFAQAQEPQASAPPPFGHALVVDIARVMAKKPFKAATGDLPELFASLNYDQYVGIRARPETNIWAADNIGFAIEPLHRGFIFSSPMMLHVVENGAARRLVYDSARFDFGKLTPPTNLPDIGFSGFRVLVPREIGPPAELAIFQGASFFRALARGQNLGAMARALALRTADPKGEEFPSIRAIWIEQPTRAENSLVIHALLDSESATGAFRFTLRPGEATIIDTECTLFARVAIENFGLGTMSATSLYGPLDRRRSDDMRPSVAEVTGLQMLTGRGEWLWRPVANREGLQISSFLDEKPKGFGFIQRDRDFEHYQDDDQHWEARPSLWIEPIGDWGPGNVQLVEIPSDSEVNDNIIAYWKPKEPLAAGSETMFAYRQFWCWSPPEKPNLAIAAVSRSGRGTSGKRRRFVVDFSGDMFADAARTLDIKPVLTSGPGQITSIRSFLSRERKSYRVLFELDPGTENYTELRLVLEAAGKPMSETWLYRWTP
jgi:periplasmic glucans biosynthesis protein